jgi:hypothetical protein
MGMTVIDFAVEHPILAVIVVAGFGCVISLLWPPR